MDILHAPARLHQNETDKCVLNERRFPLAGAHYPWPMPLLSFTGLGTAPLPGHSSTILSQNLRNQYALATILIMQFILSTCRLYPNFLPQHPHASLFLQPFSLCFSDLFSFK